MAIPLSCPLSLLRYTEHFIQLQFLVHQMAIVILIPQEETEHIITSLAAAMGWEEITEPMKALKGPKTG